MASRPSVLFVDVRSPTDYGFGHVAGAVSLPDEEFEERFSALKPRLERARGAPGRPRPRLPRSGSSGPGASVRPAQPGKTRRAVPPGLAALRARRSPDPRGSHRRGPVHGHVSPAGRIAGGARRRQGRPSRVRCPRPASRVGGAPASRGLRPHPLGAVERLLPAREPERISGRRKRK